MIRVLLPALAAALAPAQPLSEELSRLIGKAPGEVWLYAKHLESGDVLGVRAGEPVRTASTIKLPVLVALHAAAASGQARWDEMLVLREQDKVSGSGVIREMSDGARIRLRDLANLMIVVSDNTATNLILDRITADFVNAEMDKLGLHLTRSMRKVLGGGGGSLKPAAGGHSEEGRKPENERWGLGRSSAREMAMLLERIERGLVVSPQASAEMIALLKRQQYKDGIGRRLARYRVASKGGSLDALRSDVGIVYTPRGRVVLAITVDGMKAPDYSADNAGNRWIGDAAELIVEGLASR